jgi:uncharacterized protein GlcG (DUF336 family)
MLTFHTLGLAEAQSAIDAILTHATEARYRGVAVVVVDKNGEIITGVRTDGMAPRYFKSAHRKAYTAATFERDTAAVRSFWQEQQGRGHQGPADWNDPMLTTLPGGLDIVHGGESVGGIGVAGGGLSGDTSDEAFALVGLAALGDGFTHRETRA